MKNDFCKLPQEEIQKLKIPDKMAGMLLSPFQWNKQNGYVLVPEDTFQEMIDVITEHAKAVSVAKGEMRDRKPK